MEECKHANGWEGQCDGAVVEAGAGTAEASDDPGRDKYSSGATRLRACVFDREPMEAEGAAGGVLTS
jgi:hypothetical protein